MNQDPFWRDERCRTALFYAAERGDFVEVRRILFRLRGTGFCPKRQTLLEITGAAGLSAADVAEQGGHLEMANRLRHERERMDFSE